MTTLYKKQTPQFESEVKNYLKREIIIKKCIGGEFGVTLTKCAQGLFVTDVKKGTPAWRSGIDVGDIIVCVNDVVVNEDAQIHHFIYTLSSVSKINIIIKEYY